jgi:hypothetical protein
MSIKNARNASQGTLKTKLQIFAQSTNRLHLPHASNEGTIFFQCSPLHQVKFKINYGRFLRHVKFFRYVAILTFYTTKVHFVARTLIWTIKSKLFDNNVKYSFKGIEKHMATCFARLHKTQ